MLIIGIDVIEQIEADLYTLMVIVPFLSLYQCGIPRDAILGLLLYLIYVKNIPNLCNYNILLFADDTTLYMSNSNLQALVLGANAIVNLFHWFRGKHIISKSNKTKYIVIRLYQQQCNFTGLNVLINNNILKRTGNNCGLLKILGHLHR